jgi:3-hydroxymyristoyl/3-hydroxydecanoyl-(acyl carrier protein) dehydratase
MIKSVLPQIVSQQQHDNSITWRLFVDGSLDFFKGHFPEQAILPGVTQLDWAVQLGCNAFGYPSNVASLEVLKFQQLLLPYSHVDLTVSHNKDKAKLTFQYTEGDKCYSSGRIVIATEAER